MTAGAITLIARTGIKFKALAGTLATGDDATSVEVSVSEAARLCEPQRAYKSVNPAGANNALIFVARRGGTAGNNLAVVYSDPAGQSKSLLVTVAGPVITVSLATNAGSAITTTANQLLAAIRAHRVASGLVEVYLDDVAEANDGTGVVTAMTSQALAFGTNDGGVKLTGAISGDGTALGTFYGTEVLSGLNGDVAYFIEDNHGFTSDAGTQAVQAKNSLTGPLATIQTHTIRRASLRQVAADALAGSLVRGSRVAMSLAAFKALLRGGNTTPSVSEGVFQDDDSTAVSR